MATATVTDTPQVVSMEGKLQHVYGTIAVSATPDTYATGGLTIDLTGGTVHASRPPVWVEFTSSNGNIYAYVPGTTIANGKLKILSAVNTEVTNGTAIAAQYSGDTILYHAVFLGQN